MTSIVPLKCEERSLFSLDYCEDMPDILFLHSMSQRKVGRARMGWDNDGEGQRIGLDACMQKYILEPLEMPSITFHLKPLKDLK